MRRLLTIEEVSDLLGLPVRTLYGQRHRRVEPGCLGIRVGRHVRWRESDLEDFLDRQQRNERRAV
jgi:excisionase family DNA binding protein